MSGLALYLVAVVVIGIEPTASQDFNNCPEHKGQCKRGKGDCEYDDDCAYGLYCGKNNCWGEFENLIAGGNWRKDDCCTPYSVHDRRRYCSKYDRLPSQRGTCCSEYNKCQVYHGDCDKDADCESGLRCGKNNCRDFHSNAHERDDCCIPRGTLDITQVKSGCRCNNHINSYGYGQCQKSYKNWFGGAKFCYVDNPSVCGDARQSIKESWRHISAQACRSNLQVTLKSSTYRRCTEGRGASGKTTTYNWYDDKWPAKSHTAESCKALCQQDPTCPQADFYDRGDCYVYTTSTGAGVNVGGCAVGCIPKEIYFKCEEEQVKP